jgi:hypothetical protein
MRLNSYIIENIKPITAEEISSNCGPYLKDLKAGKNIFSRFSVKYSFTDITIYPLKKDRKPRDTPKALHDIMNDSLREKFGWSPRSNGLFVWLTRRSSIERLIKLHKTSNSKLAYVFPIGPYKYIYSPSIEDIYMNWEATYNERTSYVNSSTLDSPEALEIFEKWWFEEILKTYTNKDAMKLFLTSYDRIECMLKCNNVYLIPGSKILNILTELGVKTYATKVPTRF